jgi:hypothetical protein
VLEYLKTRGFLFDKRSRPAEKRIGLVVLVCCCSTK